MSFFPVAAKSRRVCQQGFTLLEVLFATTILAVVISIVYGAYHTSFRTIFGAGEVVQETSDARIIIERFNEDLFAAVIGAGSYLEGEQQAISEKRADRLRFMSSTCLQVGNNIHSQGRCMISYETEPDDETGLLRLLRKSVPYRIGQQSIQDSRSHLIGKGLALVRITYMDSDGNETDEWHSNPDDEPAPGNTEGAELPRLITLTFSFAGNSDEEEQSSKQYRTAVYLPASTVQQQ
ncbi:PulJ/GspJ family protein [Desulforhopalus singaporensis]|nr:prepilin-type N-terminal cleavage/methylation domain-containing protein [Desulforhopalus singaporensis]